MTEKNAPKRKSHSKPIGLGKLSSDQMVAARDKQDTTTRKMYVFPNDLVDRIAAFQKQQKLPSEVEAVRRLIDEALMRRDNIGTIAKRIDDMLRRKSYVPDIVRAVLIGHPLVESVKFSGDQVNFDLVDGSSGTISEKPDIVAHDSNNFQVYPSTAPAFDPGGKGDDISF